MARPGERPASGDKGGKAATNRLMALSGAIVVAVYGAGYLRTEGPAHQAASAAAVFSQTAKASSMIKAPWGRSVDKQRAMGDGSVGVLNVAHGAAPSLRTKSSST